jgi:DNA repair exonuclease SbcCD nuclease subunit
MLRLLHLSDLHLGASFADFGPLADARRQEVLDAFRALPQTVETEGVHAVVIAGNLFDTPRPTDFTLAVVRQSVRRIVDSGRPVFLIPGTHDALTCNPQLYGDTFGGATVFRDPLFQAVTVETEAGCLTVYGLGYDWAQPEPLDSFHRTDAPGPHVVLLHGALPGTPAWKAHPHTLRVTPVWLALLEADYVALGGSHSFKPPAEVEASGNVTACYSGAFAAVEMRETGTGGYVLAELEPGAPTKVQHRGSRVRFPHDAGTFDVTGFADEAAIAGAIAASVPENGLPVVKLEGVPELPLHVGRVIASLESRFGAARVEDATWYAGSSRLDELAGQDTVAGHVVRLGRARINETKDDPAAALAAERALRVSLRALRVEA